MTETSSLQLIFVDLLFLLVAGGMGFYFRFWLQRETRRQDSRIEALEKQHEGLEKLTERLTTTCRLLERHMPASASSQARPTLGDAPSSVPPPRRPSVSRPRRTDSTPTPSRVGEPSPSRAGAASPEREWEQMAERSREAYRLARELLEQGMSTTDVARQVGLGVAEVNVLKRMRDAAR
ncbi:MAG: hypothetical protein VX528_20755 [Candidatus Latescibacterota bacterium]|nr:hypothetical protein [Candidatus Latescibacterota bacterium]